MKKVPYDQLTIVLDKLIFGGDINSDEEAVDRLETIEAYIEACGWSWNDILEMIANESSSSIQSGSSN